VLGFAPLAATPFGAAGDAGISYDVSFEDAAEGAASIFAQALFASLSSETSTAEDATQVAASVFGAQANDSGTASSSESALVVFSASTVDLAQGSDTTGSIAVFSAQVNDAALGTVTVLVAPSIFGAIVLVSSGASDRVNASAVMNSLVSEGITAQDALIAAFLWNIINAAQSTSWNNVNNAQSTSWSSINNAQSTSWTVVKTEN
jgi:hypothetical protein